MFREPDLPNAPMTRWVMYLAQFEYELVHVPATKGVAQDAPSCRRPTADDSEKSQGEGDIDKFLGRTALHHIHSLTQCFERFVDARLSLMHRHLFIGIEPQDGVFVHVTTFAGFESV